MLSVIVPLFNEEKNIEECINSILNQSYSDIELIIVDDGSQDNGMELCRKYKDDRIRLISQVHSGPSLARAKGVSLARGEYVTFVDADDFIDSESYIHAIEDMKSGTDIICFGINRFFDSNNIVKEYDAYKEGLYSKCDIEKNFFPNMVWNKEKNKYGLDPSLCTKIFKKSILKKVLDTIGPIDFHYGEDVAVVYPVV